MIQKTIKAPTIKEVALHSGVSIATVSRVINGSTGVRPQVYERVRQSVKELGYNPNRAARALVSKVTTSIGVVLNNLHDPFFYDLIRGFEDGAKETNYNVIFCSTPSGASREKERYVKYLTNGVVDGVITYGSYISDEPLLHYLERETTCEHIIIENTISEVDCNELLVDNIMGARQAVMHLYELGHHNIAHICGDLNRKVFSERLNGYMKAMQSVALPIHVDYIQHATSDYNSGYSCMEQLLDLEEPPSAVFCCDDVMACHAIQAILDRGLRVPEDISIVGFDNQRVLPTLGEGQPTITTIEQPLYDIAKDSILMMAKRLSNKGNSEPIHKMYSTELVVKKSTSPPTNRN